MPYAPPQKYIPGLHVMGETHDCGGTFMPVQWRPTRNFRKRMGPQGVELMCNKCYVVAQGMKNAWDPANWIKL